MLNQAMPILFTNYPYLLFVIIMLIGLFIIIFSNNLIKKIIGLNIFQVSIITFYIAIGHINNGLAPIVDPSTTNVISATQAPLYNNPLPHVLMLTAIVVGVALTSLAFALIVRIHQNYKTIYESEINKIIHEDNLTK